MKISNCVYPFVCKYVSFARVFHTCVYASRTANLYGHSERLYETQTHTRVDENIELFAQISIYLVELMLPVVFVSRAERERLRLAAEEARLADIKKTIDENKQKRRELIKQQPKIVDVVVEKKVLPVAPAAAVSVVQKNKPKFDWDDSEDTSAVGVDYVRTQIVSAQTSNSSSLALVDKRAERLELLPWSKKLTSEMNSRDWRIFREDNEIWVSNCRNIPVPFRSWSESNLPQDLLEAIHHCGYTKPTPIQMQAIPIALLGKDLIGISSTGSGKTAAFILPMLAYIKNNPKNSTSLGQDGPLALVLAPSRELAIQIEQEATKFSSFCKIKTLTIVGGRSAEQQTMILSQGVELIVATPGRLADSLDAKQTVLNQCFYVVLDEADKMVDLGFEAYLNRILDSIPSHANDDYAASSAPELGEFPPCYRITQMFSATMPASVEKLTRKYLRNPVTVTIGEVGGNAKIDIEQRFEFLPSEKDKRRALLESFKNSPELLPAIVFVNSKRSADFVGQTLDTFGYNVIVLHSGKMQDKREDAIKSFKSGKSNILVATDVAGRGIDIPDVQHVVNYDMAKNIEDYTHRIGRTGRAGKSGHATSFILSPDDDLILPDLKKFLQQAKQFVPDELNHISDHHKRKRDAAIFI